MRIRAFLVAFSLLLLVASVCWTYTVNEYTLPVDPYVYSTNGFNSRVLSVPTHGGAVVFYNYEGGNGGHIYRWYIKSLVVDKNGIPGMATTLAKGPWFSDYGTPAGKKNQGSPFLVDIIWNGDRNGFDLFYELRNDSSKTQIRMMPLDDRGQPVGKSARLLLMESSSSDYYDFMASRIFLAGPGGRRVLLTVHQSTYEVRLRQFNSNGKTTLIREDVLGNRDRKGTQFVVSFVNYSLTRYCLYSTSYDSSKGKHGPLYVDVFDAFTLGDLPGTKNFTLSTEYEHAVFADNTHLFYNLMGFGPKYSMAYRTVGAKKTSGCPQHSFPLGDRGDILAVQSVMDRQNGKTYFDIFTYNSYGPSDDAVSYAWPYYLTRIDTNGKIIEQRQKVFETKYSNSSTKYYQITETNNGTVIYVYCNILLVAQPN
jgi:hypothetical protein